MTLRRLRDSDDAEWLRLQRALRPDHDVAELPREIASDTMPEYSVRPEAHAALSYPEAEHYIRKALA